MLLSPHVVQLNSTKGMRLINNRATNLLHSNISAYRIAPLNFMLGSISTTLRVLMYRKKTGHQDAYPGSVQQGSVRHLRG
jgi:hypothetical protein